jgi:hypothetical protein
LDLLIKRRLGLASPDFPFHPNSAVYAVSPGSDIPGNPAESPKTRQRDVSKIGFPSWTTSVEPHFSCSTRRDEPLHDWRGWTRRAPEADPTKLMILSDVSLLLATSMAMTTLRFIATLFV